jgi:hypothetical protein
MSFFDEKTSEEGMRHIIFQIGDSGCGSWKITRESAQLEYRPNWKQGPFSSQYSFKKPTVINRFVPSKHVTSLLSTMNFCHSIGCDVEFKLDVFEEAISRVLIPDLTSSSEREIIFQSGQGNIGRFEFTQLTETRRLYDVHYRLMVDLRNAGLYQCSDHKMFMSEEVDGVKTTRPSLELCALILKECCNYTLAIPGKLSYSDAVASVFNPLNELMNRRVGV